MLLWILLFLFALRVIGQLLVVAGVAPILPPMDDWQSGLLPYPALLASQIVILVLLTAVCVQFSRGRGYFVRHHAWLATPLWIVGWIYAIGMIVRYALLRRDAIPVVFHIVLAAFLLVVSQHHREPTNPRTHEPYEPHEPHEPYEPHEPHEPYEPYEPYEPTNPRTYFSFFNNAFAFLNQ